MYFHFDPSEVQSRYFYASAKRIQRSQLKISARTNNFKHYQGFKKLNTTVKEIIQHKKIIGTISHDIQSPLKYIQVIAKHLLDNPQQDPLSKKIHCFHLQVQHN
jgi:hypothetical protein